MFESQNRKQLEEDEKQKNEENWQWKVLGKKWQWKTVVKIIMLDSLLYKTDVTSELFF